MLFATGLELAEPGVISLPDVDTKQLVGIYTARDEIVALGISVLQDGVIAKVKRVMMEPGNVSPLLEVQKNTQARRRRVTPRRCFASSTIAREQSNFDFSQRLGSVYACVHSFDCVSREAITF